MRLTEILAEEFGWNSERDSELARQLNGIIKYNNGLWRSAKQAAYMQSDRGIYGYARQDADVLRRHWGVDLQQGERAIDVGGYAKWSQYGGRSIRPVTWMFVLDPYGVVRKYKIKYSGDLRQGTRVNADKTTLEWERPAGVDTSHLEKSEEETKPESTSKHVGDIGDRMTLDLTIKRVMDRGVSQYGRVWMTIAQDKDGNLFFYNGGRPLGEEGDNVTVTATINKHITTRGNENATVLKRPRVK